MPARSKPIALVKAEGNKRHLTKKEIEHREKEEKRLVTGYSFQEWPEVKNNPAAHKEFSRLKKLFKKIQKDEGLQESVINRFCMLHAECKDFEFMIKKLQESLDILEHEYQSGKIEILIYLDQKSSIMDKIIRLDKKLMDKRAMMLSIEKENLMTISSMMRAIPKKPEDETTEDPMAKFLQRG